MDTIKYSLPLGTKLKSQYEYTITQVIGQGGFGITYIATADLKVGNIVATARFAIKEFFLNGKSKRAADGVTLVPLDDPFEAEIKESLKDFITEGERINKLCRADDHIVNVNEVFTSNNTAYFVMEYINGGNLVDLMSRKGMLGAEEAKEIIIPIAKAIGKLHEEHVLHLDIKPENIMMKTTEDGKLFPVIIDFGISMHFNKQGKATTRSKNGAVSDGYSPVEQYGHVNSFAPQVDVYALGATMFYMLTGKTPQQAFDVTTEYLERSLSGTDNTVKAAVMHAMTKDSASRTETVDAFIKELNSSTKPGEQPPVSGPKPPVKPPKPGTGTVKLTEKSLTDKIRTFFVDNVKAIVGLGVVVLLAVIASLILPDRCSTDSIVEDNDSAKVSNDSAKIAEKPSSVDFKEHECVDLGLSVKWATCNVGANKPEEYGNYYAWGETKMKSNYVWNSYFDTKDGGDTFLKYATNKKTTLDLSDDAAHVNWGGNWRMPTEAEQDELRDKCTWTWTTQNGVKGYKVSSKRNSNSIFLPAAGYRYEGSLGYAGPAGYYWSSSLYAGNSGYAYYLNFGSGGVDWSFNDRYRGHSVRAVCP